MFETLKNKIQELARANIAKIIQVVTRFLRLVSKKDNKDMFEEVSSSELCHSFFNE